MLLVAHHPSDLCGLIYGLNSLTKVSTKNLIKIRLTVMFLAQSVRNRIQKNIIWPSWYIIEFEVMFLTQSVNN